MDKEIISHSPRSGDPKRGGDRDAEEQGALLHDRPNPASGEGRTIRYFSMFSGVGGFELGLEKAGRQRQEQNLSEQGSGSIGSQSTIRQYSFNCIGFSEIDKYSIQTYLKNFPDHINFGDATKIDPAKLPDFDMLCGGFPCQSFSIAGKRKGFDDTRGTMFFEIARILEVKRPRIVFLENVKGLLNHGQGATFKRITQTLEELGYDVQWMVLNSKFFGVPQNRERVFIIGSLGGTSRPEILPFGSDDRQVAESSREQTKISGCVTSRYFKQGNADTYVREGEPMIQSFQGDVSGKGYNSQEDRVHSTEGIMCCIPNSNPSNKVNIFEGTKIRRLTPTECERLQGFPDCWTEGVSDTQRYKQMGNAVTVNVIQAIGERL